MKQKRIRDFTWKDYGISPYRYRELKNFCLQYWEKKRKISSHQSELKEKWECRMIEEAAKAANGEIWKYLLKSVTEDISYELLEYDKMLGRLPMGKTDFYAYRRLFYKNLDRLKNGQMEKSIMTGSSGI